MLLVLWCLFRGSSPLVFDFLPLSTQFVLESPSLVLAPLALEGVWSLTLTAIGEGLLLCTSTGVLQEGRAGTDVAVRVAERAANLDTRSAKATDEEDRQMIHVTCIMCCHGWQYEDIL